MIQVCNNLNLGDIFLLPIPDINKWHYFVVLAILQESRQCLLTSFTSIKKGLYYDDSCVFDANDNIRYKNGELLIKQRSSIRYDMPTELDSSYLIRLKNTSRFCGNIGNSLFQRLLEGAKKSPKMQNNLKIMYNLTDNTFTKKKVILKRKVILLNQR